MKIKGFICVALIAAVLTTASFCFAADGGPIRKLGRGVANVATGILELPNNIVSVTEEDGYVAGVTYGIMKGLAWSVVRIAVGAYETVTFLVPIPFHYDPILEPEFLLSDEY